MRAIARATRTPAAPLALIAVGAVVVIAVCGRTAIALAQSGSATEHRAQARQACADRWGWMRNSYIRAGTRAIITSTSPCEVSFEYGERGDGGFSVLPCKVNKFGAYACAGHAHAELPGSTEWNAVARTRGRLVLDDPPAQRRWIARPDWVKRYSVVDGYIRPFDSRGRLRRGLKLHGVAEPVQGCGGGRSLTSTKLSCVTGYTCFAAKLPLRSGDRIACPDAPGSTRFKRGIAAADR